MWFTLTCLCIHLSLSPLLFFSPPVQERLRRKTLHNNKTWRKIKTSQECKTALTIWSPLGQLKTHPEDIKRWKQSSPAAGRQHAAEALPEMAESTLEGNEQFTEGRRKRCLGRRERRGWRGGGGEAVHSATTQQSLPYQAKIAPKKRVRTPFGWKIVSKELD